MKNRRRATASLAVVAAIVLLAGCNKGSTSGARELPQGHVGPDHSVVLTPLGAARVGLKTAQATAAGTQTAIPVQALLYEPSGQAAVYTKTGALSYTIRFITVASINGDQVIVSQGLTAGTVVVTQGAEELLGVQIGVGVET